MSPRFEVRGIRSWGKRRVQMNRVDPKAAPARPDGHDLADVLARYDERLAERSEQELSVAERQERFRSESKQLIEKILVPTLERLGKEISAHGHGWAVEERIDIQAQPAIACSFLPENQGGLEGRTTELSFRFQFPDRLAVMGAIPNGKGLRDLPARSYPTSQLDDRLVREEATRFVAAVLDEAAPAPKHA